MDIQTKLHVHNGDVTFERVQDCTAIADHTRALHNEGMHGSKDMRHAASFPMVIIEKYLNDKGVSFQEFMANPAHIKVMMTDPALAAFRVWGGKV